MTTVFVPNPPMTASEEISRAAMLVNAARLIPESTVYGTSTCRVVVLGHDGRITRSSRGSRRYPATLELANKISRFCNGIYGDWKESYLITEGDNRIIELLKDLSQPWVPQTAEDLQWDTGMMTARQYNRSQHFFPMYNTVHENVTSPLRSLFNVMVCAALERQFFKAWAMHSGATTLSDEELIEKTNKYLIDKVAGRYAGIKISPTVLINRADSVNGYSWHIQFDVHCPASRNRMTHTIVAHRNE